MSPRTTRTGNGIWILVGDCDPPRVAQFDSLMEAARAVRRQPYAPYSKFHVGAAALVDGEIYRGCNVENSSYGGSRKLEMIAITTESSDEEAIASRSPCGFCRQVMAEFANGETRVLLDAGEDENTRYKGEVIRFADLLPWQFRLS